MHTGERARQGVKTEGVTYELGIGGSRRGPLYFVGNRYHTEDNYSNCTVTVQEVTWFHYEMILMFSFYTGFVQFVLDPVFSLSCR